MTISQERKIKEYGEAEKVIAVKRAVNTILFILGVTMVEGDGKRNHYLAVDEMLSTTYSGLSESEIREAFKMYVSGTFEHELGKERYNKLDCIILGKVITAYQNYKASVLRPYFSKLNSNLNNLIAQKNELSEDEKNKRVLSGIYEAFEYYLKHKNLGVGRAYVFDALYKRGFINKDQKYIDDVIERAKEFSVKKMQLEALTDKAVKKALAEYESVGKINNLAVTCRYISIQDFFNEIIEKKQDIKEIVK